LNFRQSLALLLASVYAMPALAFDLQGHRGTRGLAPENTLAAFQRALDLGVTTIETDLAVTKDGVLVISHDPYLNPDVVRGPDGAWLAAKGPAIHSLTLAELMRYDVGRLNPASAYAKQFPLQVPADSQRFPTLAQVFALGTGKQVRFNIETKITPGSGGETPEPAAFAQLTVDAIRRAGLSTRVTVQSFDWRTLVEVKRIAPEIETACLTIETPGNDTVQRQAATPSPWLAGFDLAQHSGSLPRAVKAAGCATWSMFWRDLTPDAVTEAHGLGLKVLPWTVNDPADMARLIDWRVDGIITDYPDRLRKVMADKGMPLP
jgi:glycerophosphoryl diester phosphodiesterase